MFFSPFNNCINTGGIQPSFGMRTPQEDLRDGLFMSNYQTSPFMANSSFMPTLTPNIFAMNDFVAPQVMAPPVMPCVNPDTEMFNLGFMFSVLMKMFNGGGQMPQVQQQGEQSPQQVDALSQAAPQENIQETNPDTNNEEDNSTDMTGVSETYSPDEETTIPGNNPKLVSVAPRTKSGGSGKVKVIIEGDSLSTEYGHTQHLRKMLGDKADVVNLAKQGDSLTRIKSNIDSVLNEYDPSRKDNIVILTAGTNDLHGQAKAETLFNKLKETAQKLKDKGFTVIIGTSTKVGFPTAEGDEVNQRKAYNELIRNSKDAPWHSVVDLAGQKEFNDAPNSTVTDDKSIYAGDGLHMTGKGYKLMAQSFYDRVQNEL
jgi:lysophospholipase L1-like esterase